MTLHRIRQCLAHVGVKLLVKNGVPWCPFGPGHYPQEWLEVDTDKPESAHVEPAAPNDSASAYAKEWRASIGATLPAPTRPVAPTVRPPRNKPVPATVHRPPSPPAKQKESVMPVPKCSRCGGNGHNRRTCKAPEASATTTTAIARPAAPRATRKPRAAAPKAGAGKSKALVLSSRGRNDLEQRRNELIDQVEAIDSALTTFDLVDVIPKKHLDLARTLLEQAGADLDAKQTDGRQRLALRSSPASEPRCTPRRCGALGGRKQEILAAAAEAISGEAKES